MDGPQPPPAPAKPSRWKKRLYWLSAACALLLLAWLCRAPLLTGLARAWIINDPPAKSDAIVVLGGGLEYRPFAAAEFYKRALAPKILVMDVALSPTETMGLKEPERSVTKLILIHEGVPPDAVETVGQAVKNTYQESLAVLEWAKQHGAKRLLITTEIFHTRRVKWLFRKRFKSTEIQIAVAAAEPREYSVSNWWQNEQGLLAFQNEWVKLPYYWVKY
jgi:uncharacterized SAM-binding protein YcdF (DUF218 family)